MKRKSGMNFVELVESIEQASALVDAMPQIIWSTRADGHHDYYNMQWYDFTGAPFGQTDGDGWAGMFHPDDQERAWTLWHHSLATGDPYEVEYRLRHRSGDYRWTLGRARPIRDFNGEIIRWIGTCTDIHDGKRTAEQNELLSRELSHRIKNIFAVIGGLIGLTAREHPEAKPFASALRSRVTALGRAHEFVRPHSAESTPKVDRTTLQGLLGEIFKPYLTALSGQLRVSGDDVNVDDRGAAPVALMFHELATNAMKYGALSTADGGVTVDIVCQEEHAVITWREFGGPTIAAPPERFGFGTRLANASIVDQLGGNIEWQWLQEGLIVTVRLDQQRLVRA